MCLAGAHNSTATELKEFLKFKNLTENEMLQFNRNNLQALNNMSKDIQLNIANKIFIQNKFSIKKKFTDILKTFYFSQIENVDFCQPESAISLINNWVSQVTENKMKDFIKKDMIEPSTKLLLINAIYFKGNWSNKFNAKNTLKDNFYSSNNTFAQVDMMSIEDKRFNYKYNPLGLQAETLELPYSGEKISMTIILPNQGVHVQNIIQNLNETILEELLNTYYFKQKVKVFIPKFKFQSKFEVFFLYFF